MVRPSLVRFAGIRRIGVPLAGWLLLSAFAAAQFTIPDSDPAYQGLAVPVTNVALDSQPMSQRTRLEMIRLMEAEFAFTRIPLPQGDKGLTLKANGPLSPGGSALNDVLLRQGQAAKTGQRVQITGFEIRSRDIRLEINGGPAGKQKWYQHIQIGGGSGNGGLIPVGPQQPVEAPHGAIFVLEFDKFVPEMNPEQLRDLLSPVFDFSIKSPTQAYADSLPPKEKEAVLSHKALVGMKRDMVLNSKGAPKQKVRETNDGTSYEDWIYGEPPGEMEFIRFVGDEVVRIETMPFGKDPVIRTEREVDTPVKVAEAKPPQPESAPSQAKAPSLRRLGEGTPAANEPAADVQTQTRRIGFPPGQTSPGSGPMETPLPGPQLPPDTGQGQGTPATPDH